MVKHSPSINLFRGRNKKILDRFIHWALTGGRFLVILTEVIALSAFLYRFSLDRAIIDLNDKINPEVKRLNILRAQEPTFRNLQSRLQVATELNAKSEKTIKSLNELLKKFPAEMRVNSLTISDKHVSINANVPSVSYLSIAISKIREDPQIQSVSLGSIENKTSNATISFNLDIVLL